MTQLISDRARIWLLPSDSMSCISTEGEKEPERERNKQKCREMRGIQRSALDVLVPRGDAVSPGSPGVGVPNQPSSSPV